MNQKLSVKNLVEHLQNIYPTSSKQLHLNQVDEEDLKAQMSKQYRDHWKTSGIVQKGFQVDRLPIGDLDNWEILRTNLSKRSYEYPKQYKGIKISSIGREFSKFSDRDKKGKMPYLYESDIPKIDRLRKKIYTKPFKTANAVRNNVFGFPKSLCRAERMDKRPYSLQTLQKTEKIQY